MKQNSEKEKDSYIYSSGEDDMPHSMLEPDMGMQYSEGDGFEKQGIRFADKEEYGMYDYGFPFNDQSFQPLYVNAKQLSWIKKRKGRRDLLDSLMVSSRSNYLHESRHRHAMKRLRAPSGRFLTKEETEDFYRKHKDL